MALIDVNDCTLEVLHLPAAATTAPRAPLVFLHEGLGSVAMWRDWPARLCAATAREGWVYSRRGYGQSEPVPDVRGPARLLAIQGEGDAYGTLAQIDEIAAQVPQTQRLVLPGCGHSPHRDAAEAVTGAIAAFLAPRT